MRSVELVSVDGVGLDAVLHSRSGPRGRGVVVLAHGITADMDEGGMYVRLADRLAAAGFVVLRFSFRGHGHSGGTQRGVTIATVAGSDHGFDTRAREDEAITTTVDWLSAGTVAS